MARELELPQDDAHMVGMAAWYQGLLNIALQQPIQAPNEPRIVSVWEGMFKKAASGVLALLPCSRNMSTLRASKWLRPCWIDPSERLRA
ncbi:MAG: hypothetical protein ACE1ZW_05400, partial [Nitrospirales bacterium]